MNRRNYQKELEQILQAQTENGTVPHLLLHSCCAPCSSYVLEYLRQYFEITVFYYNPNISMETEYRRRVAEQKPDDLSVVMNMGHCHMELGNPDKALKCYFKVEFLDEKSSRALRPIAWCSLLTGNIEQSRRYYTRILNETPASGDYLNMGHLELVSGNVRDAINLYKLSIENDRGDSEAFIKSMRADTPVLVKNGVDASTVPLVIDALLYQIG